MAEADCDHSTKVLEVMVNTKRKLLSSLAIKWRIEPFISTDPGIGTPAFSLLTDVECSIEAHIDDDSDSYEFIVTVTKTKNVVRCKFYVSDINGKLLFNSSAFINEEEVFSFDSKVVETMKKESTDVVIVDCILQIYGDIETTTCNRKLKSLETEVLSKLANDIGKLLDSNFLPDVSLMVDKDIVPAHKAILCARSPVFAKTFEHDTVEREKNSVTLTDIELSVAKKLLNFLYSGQLCESDFNSYYNLYCAAVKYMVPDLRQMCAEALFFHLEIDNACQLLSLANLYGDEDLSNKVLSFIKLYLESVIKTDGWAKYIDGKLSAKIFCKH